MELVVLEIVDAVDEDIFLQRLAIDSSMRCLLSRVKSRSKDEAYDLASVGLMSLFANGGPLDQIEVGGELMARKIE